MSIHWGGTPNPRGGVYRYGPVTKSNPFPYTGTVQSRIAAAVKDTGRGTLVGKHKVHRRTDQMI